MILDYTNSVFILRISSKNLLYPRHEYFSSDVSFKEVGNLWKTFAKRSFGVGSRHYVTLGR